MTTLSSAAPRIAALLSLAACAEPAPFDPQPDPVGSAHGAPWGSGPLPDRTPSTALLEPAYGTYFGASLDLEHDTMAAFDARLGRDAADFVGFVRFPLDDDDVAILDGFLAQAAGEGALAVVTVEPRLPLTALTPAMAEALADRLGQHTTTHGLGVLLRFAHEMNGPWYPWGQQPVDYVDTFRMVAEIVHDRAPLTAMVWAPNYGGGYPFGGAPQLAPGSADFVRLDTDEDGAITAGDDPYLPYYPGDDAVDWVGLSLYHWGSAYPWGENEIPEATKFVDQLVGAYDGLGGDHTAAPDYYDTFTVQRGKPLAIVETGALYHPATGGATELEIKAAWWDQVFDALVSGRFPRMRLVNWFELIKESPEVGGGTLDWTVTRNPHVRRRFTGDLPEDVLIFGPVAPP